MAYNRTISSNPHREEVFKKLMEYAPPGVSFSEMLGRIAAKHLKEGHTIATTPSIESKFEDWQEYSLDCNQEEFAKLTNFSTRLTNTVKRHEGKIRK